jgi:hypothetical protein
MATVRDMPDLKGETISFAVRSEHSIVIAFASGRSISVACYSGAPLTIEQQQRPEGAVAAAQRR